MIPHYDTAVIGGGIIGCAIAYYLSKEKIPTLVLESGEIGGKATSAAAGMLGAHSECEDLDIFYPFARSSQLAYFKLRDELRDVSGIDIELTEGGIFKLAIQIRILKSFSLRFHFQPWTGCPRRNYRKGRGPSLLSSKELLL